MLYYKKGQKKRRNKQKTNKEQKQANNCEFEQLTENKTAQQPQQHFSILTFIIDVLVNEQFLFLLFLL